MVAVKYSHANEIRVELVYKSTSCCLRIKDNGRGFEVNNTTLSRGFGLLGMTERAEHIGAQLLIESQLGQGTEVSVSVQREAVI
jgi:signal transduction histidine kinase